MNIKGKFEVTLMNIKTFESKKFKGENLITNIGKNYICDFLKRDNYTQWSYDDNFLSGGKTIFDEKIISIDDITPKSYWTANNSNFQSKNPESCLYSPVKNNYTFSWIYNYNSYDFETIDESYKRECSIYFDFEQGKNIKKIVLQCNPADSESVTSNGSGCQLEISTSQYTSEKNINWTVRKYMMLPSNWNIKNKKDANGYNTSEIDLTKLYDLPIYLGDRDNPEKTVENVRSIRITPARYGLKIYNALFFEEVKYPNPPCIIGLGSSRANPNVKDIDLGYRNCTLFAKCTVEEKSVTYRARLGIRESNGNVFNEIGLYSFDGSLPYSGQKLKLFSHGLFEKTWTKTEDIIADIKYVITADETTENGTTAEE